MALLLLTDDNLHATKSGLRLALPDVNSAHLTEALAAACGYRTHAALRADLKTSALQPPLARLDATRFRMRLSELGYAEYQANDLARIVRSDLPDPIWRMFPQRDRLANNDWYRQCQRRNIPDIHLHVGRKYWRLNWDCISTDKTYDERVHGPAGDALVRVMFMRFQDRAKLNPGEAMFEGSAFVGRIERLLPEIACDLADDFFAMFYSPKGPA